MNRVTPRTASGFPEYLPEEQLEFNRLLSIIREVYELYGFSPIDTPDMELAEVLLAKGGGETEKQVYRFERGRNDFALRFDLTVPLARYAAQHQGSLVFPFRRYHIGKVHRAERAQAGRFREFYQCDIDVIGSESPLVDAEFPAIINDVFTRFDFGEFTIKINDRKVLNGFFEGLGLLESATGILRTIDKMEKVDLNETTRELEAMGLTPSQIEAVLGFVAIEGRPSEVIGKLRALANPSDQLSAGIQNLEYVVTSLEKMGVPAGRYKIDLRIARGLDYYTGTVYETILDDYPEVGSVCSGGRFDNLAEYYTDTRLPGVGISIGLTRLFYKLREAGIIKAERRSPANVVIAPMSLEQFEYALEISSHMRLAGIPCVLYTEPDTMKKKVRYANRMGFKHLVVIGELEVSSSTVTVKNMRSGNTETCDLTKLIEITSP